MTDAAELVEFFKAKEELKNNTNSAGFAESVQKYGVSTANSNIVEHVAQKSIEM